MAKFILVANWKNYPNSLEEADSLLKAMSKKRLLYKKVSLFVAPPLTYLERVSARIKSFAKVASQDMSLFYKGARTGEITPEILKSFGVRMTIVGHSERRALGETVEVVRDKVKSALRAGITPLVCFGERERDHDGEHFEFLRDELKQLLSGVSKKDVSKIVLAYEPVWAIGKSARDAMSPLDLSQTVMFIKKVLADLFGREVSESVPILYGGSVELANAQELTQGTGIKGFLVGHASLKSKSLEAITRLVLER